MACIIWSAQGQIAVVASVISPAYRYHQICLFPEIPWYDKDLKGRSRQIAWYARIRMFCVYSNYRAPVYLRGSLKPSPIRTIIRRAWRFDTPYGGCSALAITIIGFKHFCQKL